MSTELNEKLGTTNVVWNLEDLYESMDDELIHDDIDLCEQEAGLLAEGGSQSPYDLLKPFNVDLNDPSFWKGGLLVIEDMLQEVER